MRNNRMSIRFQFALIFIGILVFSCFVAFGLTVNFSGNILKDAAFTRMENLTRSTLTLLDRTDLSLSEIEKIIGAEGYDIGIYGSLSEADIALDSGKQAMAASGEPYIYSLTGHRLKLFWCSITYADGNYLVIRTAPDSADYGLIQRIVLIAMSMCGLLGSLLMSFAISKITRPIIRITEATKEVAKGNFDIEVHTKTGGEVSTLSENFNAMTKQLHNMEILRKDFIRNVSHEFKTPLASIQGFARRLKKEGLSLEKQTEYTDIILEETERLSTLSSNILNLSRLENQNIPNKKSPFSLDEQLRKTILLLQNQWEHKDILFDISLDHAGYVGDEELTSQIWINLIGNAVKFSGQGGKVIVDLTNSEKELQVSVKNGGTGIPAEKLPYIFDKFYQADPSHNSSGNGLGLSIVWQITQMLGYRITARSEPGEQTCFTVFMPK